MKEVIQMTKTKKRILISIAFLFTMAITAFITYHIVMHSISISISEDTAQITVFDQTDDYDYNFVNMNPTQNK